MMINIGEKLDIAYTTDNFLVTVPTDGHTSAAEKGGCSLSTVKMNNAKPISFWMN